MGPFNKKQRDYGLFVFGKECINKQIKFGNLPIKTGHLTLSSFIFFLFLCINTIVNGQVLAEFKTPGTYSWTVPPGFTSITIQAWGAGGGGNTSDNATGGGGGGAFASSTIQVVPGEIYTIIVGPGGAPGNPGNNTAFYLQSTPQNIIVRAEGGQVGNGGSGGLISNSIGQIRFAGGNGGTRGGTNGSGAGGGGGGSARATANGGAGSAGGSTIGGAGGAGAGAGGKGGNTAAVTRNGADGVAPGGGGGGKGNSNPGDAGTGAPGMVTLSVPTQIIYNDPDNTLTFTVPPGVSSISVQAWGGGGAGGPQGGNNAQSGGGGGAFASRNNIAVTPGQTFPVIVGRGGTVSTNATTASGGYSQFGSDTYGNRVKAAGGTGVNSQNNGNGGQGGNILLGFPIEIGGNALVYSGGSGGSRQPGSGGGGGGGGSAFPNANGSPGFNGSGGIGGLGGNGAGRGGRGGSNISGARQGNEGVLPGGGGGGRGSGSQNGATSGAGADGQVIITWISAAQYQARYLALNSGNPLWCEGESREITLTVENGGNATWNNNIKLYYWWSGETRGSRPSVDDFNGLTSGSSTTKTFTVNAPTGTGNFTLNFDIRNENSGNCWFSDNSGNCGPGNFVFSSPPVSVNQKPTANAGSDVITCSASGGINISAGSSASNYEFTIWATFNGTGEFVDQNSLNEAYYTPSLADTAARSVTIALIAANGGCYDTSYKRLDITPAPVINLGPVTNACSDISPINFAIGTSGYNYNTIAWTSNGSGTINNATSMAAASFEPTAADLSSGSLTFTITAQGNPGCSDPVVLNKIVSITQKPEGNAGANQTICSNGSNILVSSDATAFNNNGILWETSGSGLFNDAISLNNARYTPSSADSIAGSVTLTLRIAGNGSCADFISSKVLAIQPATYVYAGPDLEVCENTTNILVGTAATTLYTTAVQWTSSGTGAFISPTSLNGASYNPSIADKAAGFVTLTLAGTGTSPCTNAIHTKKLIFTPVPSATIAYPSSDYCNTGSLIAVTQTGTSGGVYTASPSGLSISTGDGSINPATSTSGTYTIFYTIPANGGCQAFVTTTSITVTAQPNATISYVGNPFCTTFDGQQTVVLFPSEGYPGARFTANSSNLTLNDETGRIRPKTSVPGTYYVKYEIPAIGGCPATESNTTTVIITQPPEADINYPANPVCSNQSVALVSLTGQAGGSFSANSSDLSLNGISGQVNILGSIPGTYSISYTLDSLNNCDKVVKTVPFTITKQPIATFSYPTSIVCSNSPNILPDFVTGGQAGTFSSTSGLVFEDASTGEIDVAASTPGTYTITNNISAASGCGVESATFSLTISALPNAGFQYLSTPFCQNDVNPGPSFNPGAVSGTFSSSALLAINSLTGVVNLAGSTPGTYTVTNTIAAVGGCTQVQATSDITITALPTANISYTSVPYCNTLNSDQSVSLSGSGGYSGGVFSVSPNGLVINDVTGSINPFGVSANDYTVTYTIAASGGCGIVQASTLVKILPPGIIDLTSAPETNNQTICAEDDIEDIIYELGGSATSASVSGLPAGLSFGLNAGVFTIWGTPSETGTFNYTVSVSGSCTEVQATGTIFVKADATLTLNSLPETSSQNLCSGSSVSTISYQTGGALTGVLVSGLPAGVNYTYSDLTGIVTIFGTPSVNGIFNYKVETTGSCTSASLGGTIRIDASAPEQPASITGLLGICPPISGLEYEVPNNPLAANYNWTLPTGWNITSGEGTHKIVVTLTGATVFGVNTIQVSAANGCGTSAVQTLNVAVNDFAGVTISPVEPVCTGSTVSLTAVFSGSAVNGTWQTSGDGVFGDVFAGVTTYTPGANDLLAGNINITNTSNQVGGGCPAGFDEIVVNLLPLPFVNITGETTICEGGSANLTISGTANTMVTYTINGGLPQTIGLGAGGSAIINTGVLTATATLSITETAYTSGTSCAQAISGKQAIVTVNPTVLVQAGANQTVCSNGSINLTGIISGGATTGTWSAPSGSFGNINDLNTSYTPGIASGTVLLTLTSDDPDGPGPCAVQASDILVTVNQAATVIAGSPQTVCQGGTVNLAGSLGGSASSATWSAGSGNFSNALSLVSNYTPSITNGDIDLTLTTNDPDGAGPCSAATSVVKISVNEAATVSAGGNQTICAGGTATMAGSFGGSATSGVWTTAGSGSFDINNIVNAVYSPSANDRAAGSVTLTYTSNDPTGPCNAVSANMQLTISPIATANASVPQTICEGGVVNLIGTVGGAATSGTWTAPDGSGSFSNANNPITNFTPSISSGTVLLTLTTNDPAGPCNAAVSTVLITVNPTPAIPPNPTGPSAGCGSVIVTKTGNPDPGIEWYWQVSPNGTATNNNGNNDLVITTTTSIDLYIRALNPATGCWSNGSGLKNVIVYQIPIAPLSISSNSPQCSENGVTLTRSNPIVTTVEYFWQTTPTGTETAAINAAQTYTTLVSGTYYLRSRSKASLCWSTAISLPIVVNPAPANPANPVTPIAGCAVDGVTLTRNGTPDVGETWFWQLMANGTSTVNSGETYTVFNTGTYYLRARNNISGCWSAGAGSVAAIVNSTPATPGIPTTNSPQCTIVTLTRNGTVPGSTQWYWQTTADGTSTANSSSTFDVSVPGTYFLRARSDQGCWSVNSTSATATFKPLPDAPAIPTSNSPQCANPGVTLTKGNEPSLAVTWYWQGTNANGTDIGSDAKTYLAGASGTYYLRSLDNTGCWSNASSSVTVTVNPLPAQPVTTINVTGNNNCEDAGTTVTRLTDPPGNIGWYWQPTVGEQVENNNTNTFVTRVPGNNYSVYLRAKHETTGCWSAGSLASPSITVRPNPLPEIVPNYCFGGGKVALNVKSSTTPTSYTWTPVIPENNINNQATYFVDVAEVFTVNVTYPGGCSRSNFIQVSENLVFNPSFTLGNVGFKTAGYKYVANNPSVNNELIPEGYYGVGKSGQDYHPNFWGIDHTRNTTGDQNMLIVNGWSSDYIVWEQEVKITPNTNYYFSAYGMSLNQVSPYGRLRFEIEGKQAGTIAELGPGPGNAAQANANNYWKRFYSEPLWNSSSLSPFPADSIITIRIINLEAALGGNDFAIDDINFGALSALPIQNIAVNVGSVITFCPGSSIKLVATFTGGKAPYNFTWTGPNGFTSTDREPFITNASNLNSGRYTVAVEDGFGCEPTTAISDSLIIRNPNIGAGQWTGFGNDNDWYNCQNWESGTIPTSLVNVNLSNLPDEVVINPGSEYHNGAAVTRNLVINRPLRMADASSELEVHGGLTINGPNGVVNATNGGEIQILGDGWFNNRGTAGFLPGTNSHVIFRGAAPLGQSIFNSSGKETFSNLTIDNQGSAIYNVAANSAIDVTGNFNIQTGRLQTTETNLLTVTNPSASSVSGGNNSAFVSGPMARNMNTTNEYYFPVGKFGAPYISYRPVSVIPKTGNLLKFRSEYHITETPDLAYTGEFVTGAIKTEWWKIDRLSGTDSARVKLNYITPSSSSDWSTSQPPNNQFSVAIVKHSGTGNNDGTWYFTDFFSADKSGFNLDPANPESVPWFSQVTPGIPIYSKYIQEFSPFTFAYAYYMILPIRLITFTGEIVNKQTLLKWTVADNNEVNKFVIEHSTDGNRFSRAGEVWKGSNAAYQFFHSNVAPGNNYYRLKMIGKDGTELYSKVVMVTYGLFTTTINGIKPTLVKDYSYVSVESAKTQAIYIKMYDMGGRLIRTEKSTLQIGVNTVPVFMLNLPAALYNLTVVTDDGAHANFKVMRE